jgi:serine-type D-Ala-D-Ala carboxypeptidase (penicillin-binding protein 5/6)
MMIVSRPGFHLFTAVVLLRFFGDTMIAAESYLVADQASGHILMTKGADIPRQVASLTKIATTVVAFEWLGEHGGDLNQTVTIIPEAVSGGVNPLNLKIGDQLILADAIRASMMASDNTSAYALAAALGSQMRPGSDPSEAVAAFVEKLNTLTARLGMERTHFVNPHGLDGGKTDAFSTASDIARLAIHACDLPDFLSYCREKESKTTIRRGGVDVELTIVNTNELVGSRGIDGMKTGTTTLSGPCLVATATRDFSSGGVTAERRLIVVALKAGDRFREAVLLFNKGWPACEKWLEAGAVIEPNDHLRKRGN